MATTFVVEDGTGLPTANSYISEANADQYLEDFLEAADFTTWNALTSAVKQLRLRQATRYIDMAYGRRKLGTRVLSTQALEWPVSNGVTHEGFAIVSTSVPGPVEDATSLAAWKQVGLVAATSSLLPDLTSPGTVTRLTQKAGPVEETTEWMSGNDPTVYYQEIERAIAGVVMPAGRILLA